MKKFSLITCVVLMLAAAAAGILLRHEDAARPVLAETYTQGRRIIVDAGHGEPDGGAVGSALGTREDDLNLAVANKLKILLEDAGYEVIMTRETEEQIGSSKKADMAERRRIIEESNQLLTVSIHQNFYGSDGTVSGPQVFYAPGSREGQILAAAIQQALNEKLQPHSPRTEHEGDYYIVKSGAAPAVIVECGFLSNGEEEANLLRSQYQVRIAKAIFAGIEQYLTTSASAE